MSSQWWRRKPNKWHQSNKVRGFVPSTGGFSARTRHTGLPKQSHMRTFRPGKLTNYGGYPRTTNIHVWKVNRIRSVSRKHTVGVSLSRHGFPIALGRGGAPGRPIALGVGSGGKSQALAKPYRIPMYKAKRAVPAAHRISPRTMYALGGAAAIGAGGYAAHKYRQHRVRRNSKGQFAGSY